MRGPRVKTARRDHSSLPRYENFAKASHHYRDRDRRDARSGAEHNDSDLACAGKPVPVGPRVLCFILRRLCGRGRCNGVLKAESLEDSDVGKAGAVSVRLFFVGTLSVYMAYMASRSVASRSVASRRRVRWWKRNWRNRSALYSRRLMWRTASCCVAARSPFPRLGFQTKGAQANQPPPESKENRLAGGAHACS